MYHVVGLCQTLYRFDEALVFLGAMFRERGSTGNRPGGSRVWRRLTDDQLEHRMPCTIDNRRQTRIETLAFQDGSQFEGSRYGPGGKSRLMRAFSEH